MNAYADESSGIRPLADADLDDIGGGNPVLVAGVVLAGAALGFTIMTLAMQRGYISAGVKAGARDMGL